MHLSEEVYKSQDAEFTLVLHYYPNTHACIWEVIIEDKYIVKPIIFNPKRTISHGDISIASTEDTDPYVLVKDLKEAQELANKHFDQVKSRIRYYNNAKHLPLVTKNGLLFR